ncbi:MAG TPA: hypothetical protein VGN73_11725 [Gemmatimonadaceae bacterium]|nr:hypothetical protein [Gemmatimonadaceae bacterium]
MTEDNKFEEFLRTKAQGYNTPPVRVPRDEMWTAIQARRAAGPRVVYGGGLVAPISARRFGTKVWLGAAAAAMLLVATGVGIGRWTASPTTARVATASPTQPEGVAPATRAATRPDIRIDGAGISAGGTENRPEVTDAGSQRTGNMRQGVGRNNSGEARTTGVGNRSAVASGDPAPTPLSPAERITVGNHLGQAEALLTSFRTRSTADQQMDAQLGSWARQLLNNTRLLLDSPVANDPQRRPLLEDLELVLVQIVQLSPGSTPQDREMIEKTLQQDHVMTRLRIANPANAQRGG